MTKKIYICTLVSDWDDNRNSIITIIKESLYDAHTWLHAHARMVSADENVKVEINEDSNGYYAEMLDEDGSPIPSMGWEKAVIKEVEIAINTEVTIKS